MRRVDLRDNFNADLLLVTSQGMLTRRPGGLARVGALAGVDDTQQWGQ